MHHRHPQLVLDRNITSCSTEQAVSLLSRCPQLASLTLEHRRDLTELLTSVGQHCQQLRSLRVHNDRHAPATTRLTYSALKAVGEGCPGLRGLDLEERQLSVN